MVGCSVAETGMYFLVGEGRDRMGQDKNRVIGEFCLMVLYASKAADTKSQS